MIERIGLTMRVTMANDYSEPRDALAHDWPIFLAANFPSVKWISIPNILERPAQFVKDWGLDGILLTGGNDIGEFPQRDSTELELIDYAQKYDLPLLGVCRGLQLVNKYFGGEVRVVESGGHRSVRHAIKVTENIAGLSSSGKLFEVNSFHNQGVKREDLGSNLEPVALASDGFVEAFRHVEKPIFAMQWHPEREKVFSDLDRAIFSKVFGRSIQ